jgi:L-ascorbate metabolism protein UlaG (beta-lactamase superfamily)
MATVVTDPFDHQLVGYEQLKLKADILTISHDSPNHNYKAAVSGEPFLVTGPGEYEVGGVFITGVPTHNPNRKSDEASNTLYVFDYNGINIAHLGDMNNIPSQTEVETLGPIHIALVPIGSNGCLNAAKAAEVISLLEPNIVIPMHYATPGTILQLDPLSKFLKEMGLAENAVTPQSSLKINGTGSLSEETKVIILDYQRSSKE